MITADHLLNVTVTIERRQTVDDGMGGRESEWREVGQLPARVAQPATGRTGGTTDTVNAAQLDLSVTHRVYLVFGSDVVRGDRIITPDGRELAVIATATPSEPAYLRADCRHSEYEPTNKDDAAVGLSGGVPVAAAVELAQPDVGSSPPDTLAQGAD